jgi:hypothetical protein
MSTVRLHHERGRDEMGVVTQEDLDALDSPLERLRGEDPGIEDEYVDRVKLGRGRIGEAILAYHN